MGIFRPFPHGLLRFRKAEPNHCSYGNNGPRTTRLPLTPGCYVPRNDTRALSPGQEVLMDFLVF